MKIYHNKQYILVKSFSSKNEMKDYTEKYRERILIESTSGYDNTYEIITLSEEDEFCIGIMYNWQGVESSAIITPAPNQLFLAFECEVVLINLDDKKILQKENFPLPIYTIKFIEQEEVIVVIYEMGVCVFSTKGKKLWEMGTSDTITEYVIKHQYIRLESMDGNKVTFSTLDGKVL